MYSFDNKSGIIIQARSLSTRLPNKLFLPFHQGRSIIDILLNKVSRFVDLGLKVVLATSISPADDVFETLAKKNKLLFFRGSESNVLDRFCKAASEYGINNVVRVCADNPIYDFEGTLKLLKKHIKTGNDYTAYQLKGGLPSIKSHLGFWGEVVSLKALEKVAAETTDRVYLEHVTNYIYTHPGMFKIDFENAPDIAFERDRLRFTVDTLRDFDMMKDLYEKLFDQNPGFSIDEVIGFVDDNPGYLKQMARQIDRNKK